MSSGAQPSTSGLPIIHSEHSNTALPPPPEDGSHVSKTTSVTSRSSRSSATIRARKAAAEAVLLRRQLDQELELAERERERERNLANLRRQVEERELQAELVAIDAEAASSRGSKRSIPVSIERTQMWVNNHNHFSSTNGNRGLIAEECDNIAVTLPSQVLPPTPACTATRDPAPPVIHHRTTHRQTPFVTIASEVEGRAPPHIVSEPVVPDINNSPMTLLQAVADTAAAAKALASGQGKSRLDLPKFFGDILQWLNFKRIYNVTKSSFSPLENVARLQNALRGVAYEAVASVVMSSENPEEIMSALEDNFERPELIVYREVATLKSLPRLGNDLKELGTLANRVRNSISTIRLLNQVEYLYSPELFHAVLGKLNPTMKIRWTDFAVHDTTQRSKLEILSDYLKRELDQHVRFGLSPEGALPSSFHQLHSVHNEKSTKRENVHSTIQTTKTTNQVSTTKQLCCFCKKDHNIKTCSEFRLLSIDNRWCWIRENKVCYRCLKRNPHQWKTCKVNPCGIDNCVLRHHPLLHGRQTYLQNNVICTTDNENTPTTSGLISDPVDEKVIVSATGTVQPDDGKSLFRPQALLKIIPVTVSGPTGDIDTFALLDDGSTATLIDASIASRIGVTGPKETITVNCVGGLTRSTEISYVDFHIKGRYTSESYLIENARSIDSISLQPQTIQRDFIISYPHLNDLVDVLSYSNATPMILIGADHWHLSINRDIRKRRRNEPVACLTTLGWVLYGSSSSKTKVVNFVNNLSISDSTNSLEFLIKQQYKLDSIGISKQDTLLSKQDKRAISILESTTRRLPSGRFEIGLPWKENIAGIPDSYAQALSRFISLERRMAKEPEFAQAYKIFINNMVEKEYSEECHPNSYHDKFPTDDNTSNVRWYLPHFGVYHPQKRKLRVVHDAAASNVGVSLNSMLLSGPDLLQSLLGILFRFREGRIAFTADIKEMFPQIRVRKEDRDALRYLWRDSTNSTNSKTEKQPIKEFRMTSVIFGACSSPFIAQYIKNKNAKEFEHLYTKAVNAILYNHYMDDYLDSHDDIHEAAQIAADIVTVHSAACLEMRGWISNDQAALNLVSTELRAAKSSEVNLGSNLNNVRVLGISWDPISDSLGFRTGFDESLPNPLTKRKVLSHLMRVYDPLGLLAPIVVKGRILFQQAWRSNIGWDTEFPPSEVSKWTEWFQSVAKIATIRIPRWYSSCLNLEPVYRELHVFADASELAYTCVAYWRLVYADSSIKLALISSKARVTPLKPVSIPRLELQAALMASRLAVTIKESHRKKPSRTIFWSDSLTVLGWIRSDARTFKPFVAHRIGEIIENSSVTDWKWVPTDLNVADDATRARNINLDSSSRWFNGPPFLFKSSEDWPVEPAGITPVREECKTTELVRLLTVASVNLPTPVTANFANFSSWLRLVRATARVLQAVAIFRGISGNSRQHITTSTTLVPLTADLMNAAERQILQKVQLDSFKNEFECLVESQPIQKKSRLVKLSPIVGQDKLIRLAGRIKAVKDVDQDTRLPIILDGSHPIVRLLVLHYHRIAGHGNNEMVVNELRQKYWIIHLRPTVRSVASKCLFCRIRKSQPTIPVMGNLPPQRLAHHRRPFTFTGVDYFGPITTTIGRRHEKRYVALYTCMTTRAVHLELVHSLSADSAIMSLRRFIARRGTPDIIFSDNGTAFVGANRHLKEFYQNEVEDFAATKRITWRFIPAAAPSFGGCWERMVRAVKTALSATLHERAPKEEVLKTLLLEAEAIVNSRPLAHVSVDQDVNETLTPFHFLIGTSSTQALPTSLSDRDLCSRLEYRKALRLADHFWNRWVREILPTLQPREPGSQTVEIKVGDPVLIVDETMPRGTWPRGRISSTHPGKDGVVRVVDVETAAGTLRRPRRKVVPLPI